ncbi:pyridoxamine 5'-phosphate oxidase family protein [Amycolatopsis anabasis]|uniref:pyridoxamine 5'-phosphate oxidase family protein n=1 Tax=Amycolatopsis anabasis TaxID=1840409 RepID=UPI00131BC38B|nr:pyridoxamine 5'-phosphate oxidase family protein [Amycolatopsis anabasis]
MTTLAEVAPSFVDIAHRVVWANVTTVDRSNRPRSRVLHPIWQWDGESLVGWIGTAPTPVKRAHLAHSPYVSVGYWAPSHDNATAECHAELLTDDETRTKVWNLLKQTPEPLGYDPGGIGVPGWDTPTSPAFAALRLRPWRLRALSGDDYLAGRFDRTVTWRE